MKNNPPTKSVSFTQQIQSTEDLRYDDSFFYTHFKFINGECSNASLTFWFEEIDFQQNYTEYIDIFYPEYPLDQLAHCTAKNDFNCGTWINCVSRLYLEQPTLDTSDNSYNYEVSVIKSAEINKFCNYSINANVTINCGPAPPPTPGPTMAPSPTPTTAAPTSLFTNFSGEFDLLGYRLNDSVAFTIPVQSERDNYVDALFNVDFHFKNGLCHSPQLRIGFEEVESL